MEAHPSEPGFLGLSLSVWCLLRLQPTSLDSAFAAQLLNEQVHNGMRPRSAKIDAGLVHTLLTLTSPHTATNSIMALVRICLCESMANERTGQSLYS